VLDEGDMRPLKEHEQVRRAVVVEVNHRPDALPGDRVKILDEIDLIVEVSIGLATDKNAALVVLVNVRQPVEVAVSYDFRKAAVSVVDTPQVGLAVTVQVLCGNGFIMKWVGDEACRTAEQRQECREPPSTAGMHGVRCASEATTTP
jgi:hypothetical protein